MRWEGEIEQKLSGRNPKENEKEIQRKMRKKSKKLPRPG